MIFEFFILIFSILSIYYLSSKNSKKYPPGPLGFPILGHLPILGTQPHKKITEIGKKYGKIFSLKYGAFDVVVLNDVDLVKTCFKSPAFAGRPNDKFAIFKLMEKFMTFNEGDGLTQQRKFTIKKLSELGFGKKEQDSIISDDIEELIQYLKTKMEEPFDLKTSLELSISNSLMYIVMNKKHVLGDDTILKLIHATHTAIIKPSMSIINFVPWLVKIFPNMSENKEPQKAKEILENYFQQIIDEHWATFNPDAHRDLIDAHIQEILNATDPKSFFYGDSGKMGLLHNLITMFVGGSDTSSASLLWLILLLLKYPEALKKVQKEIKSVVGKSRRPNLSDRPNMPYLEATINEAWRFTSFVPNGVYHSTIEDVEVEGYFLPKRTIVIANTHGIDHNELYWGDPDNFRPERFIKNGKFQKDEKMITFSVGRRNCIAENIATNQLFLFASALLQTFEFTKPEGETLNVTDAETGFVLIPMPFKVNISLRK